MKICFFHISFLKNMTFRTFVFVPKIKRNSETLWYFCKILKILIFEKSKFSNSIIIVNFWKIVSIQVVETLFNMRRLHSQQKLWLRACARALLILENGKKWKKSCFFNQFWLNWGNILARSARGSARAPNFYIIVCAWSFRWLLHQKRIKNL